MKRKKIITVLIVVVALTVYLIIIGIKEREKEIEKENLLIRQSREAEKLLNYIPVDGEVIIQDDKVVINDLEFCDIDLIVRIYYMNAKVGLTITPEQIKEQFYIYVKNYEFDESTEELKDYCEFVYEEGIAFTGRWTDYRKYAAKIWAVLNEQGLDYETATREQLEAACEEALEELGY